MPATKTLDLRESRFRTAITSSAWRRREYVVATVAKECCRNPDDVDAAIGRMAERGVVLLRTIREVEYVRGTA